MGQSLVGVNPMNNGNGENGANAHVEAVVRSAEREIRELLRQRAELMRRIGTIKRTLAGLADMFGDAILNQELLELLERKTVRQSGFTRACRTVLMESAIPLSARQVRDRIQQTSPHLITHHKDPLASIATVLGRLVQHSEANCTVLGPGRRVWDWAAERRSDLAVVGTMAPLRENAPCEPNWTKTGNAVPLPLRNSNA
jgi:hypothetical protein